MRRHGGAGNAGRDDAFQVFLGSGMAEFSGPEINVVYQIAVGPVARDTVRGIDSRTAFDIGLAVLAGMLLSIQANDAKDPRGTRQRGHHSLEHRARDST